MYMAFKRAGRPTLVSRGFSGLASADFFLPLVVSLVFFAPGLSKAAAQDAWHSSVSNYGPAPRRIEYRSAGLQGDPVSPIAGLSSLVEIEAYDAQGRLVLLARRLENKKDQSQSPTQSQTPAQTPAQSQTQNENPTGSRVSVEKVASQSSFLYREFSYDRAGRLAMVTERPGPGLPYSRRDILHRDADGRPVSLIVEAGGKKTWTLDYRWNGSGTEVFAVLRDGSGGLAAYDDLNLGGGAAGEMALQGIRHSADGSVQETLSAAIDSGGRLSFISRSAPESPPDATALAAAGVGASAGSAEAPTSTVPSSASAASSAVSAPVSAASGSSASATPGGATAGSPQSGPPAPELGAYLLPAWPGSGPWTWSAAAAAGMVLPPFAEPRVEKASDKEKAAGSDAALVGAEQSASAPSSLAKAISPTVSLSAPAPAQAPAAAIAPATVPATAVAPAQAPAAAIAPATVPTPISKGASADFLYDEAGRLVRARLIDSAGYLVSETDYQWDAIGRLVETDGDTTVVYRYVASRAGLWTERLEFLVPAAIPAPVDESLFTPVSRETRAIRFSR
jgi:hypothetical protein